ncbi:MAG: type II secretion system F family protein, partial [Clostridium sp.]
MSRQVSVMLSSGINVVSAFEMLLSQKNSKSMTRALRSVVKDIQSGGSLHSSIEKTGYFPDAFTSMVMIGENSGNLDNVFMRLSEYYYKEYKTKHTIRQAMAYPIFILVVTFIAAILMATTILPMIANMIKGLEIGELPLPTKILMNINLYLSNRIFLIVMAFGMCFLGVFIHMKKDMIIQRVGFKIPIINSMYKKIVTAKFARSLSMLFSSGIPIIEALALCEVLLGRVYIKYMREIKDRVESGDSLYLAING